MSYRTPANIEQWLAGAANDYSSFTSLITLPHKTHENRTCHALKIASGTNSSRPGIFFQGGIHAGELASPDILLHFIWVLAEAYKGKYDIVISGSNGTKTFTKATVKALVETFDIIVFPLMNPDGRQFAMTPATPSDPNYELYTMWRKNRRVLMPNPDELYVGVDLNRNYDYVWKISDYFAAASAVNQNGILTNVDGKDYQGDEPASEPETQNSKYIFDHFPNIGYFIDMHSPFQRITYIWNDCKEQTEYTYMNFQNGLYKNYRGTWQYIEYIPPKDLQLAKKLANALHDGIVTVNGTDYPVTPGTNDYAYPGASVNYAYSRHFVNSSLKKVIGLTLETPGGTQNFYAPDFDTCTHPITFPEVTAGLLEFCVCVLGLQ